ncbi:MAG: ECF-type sigma factor [Betaproteobacteria bacterium]
MTRDASPSPGNATDLMVRVRDGDVAAKNELFTHCYPELKRLAHARLLHTNRSATLDTTALVHDVYLKLANMGGIATESRGHFMAYAAHTMRSLIIDVIRARSAEMRGGNAQHLSLDTDLGERLVQAPEGAGMESVLDIHAALDQLSAVDPRLVQVVEMRYFAGFSEQEIADVLGITERTVRRDWQRARVLLAAALGPGK